MEYIGKQVQLGVGVEETRGTPQTVADKWIKKVELTLLPKNEKMIDPSVYGGILADSSNRRVVRKWYDGNINGIVHADTIGYFIYNIMGTVTSTQLSGIAYKHEFEFDNNIQHPSLSFIVKDGVEQNVLDTAMIKTLEINAVQNDLVKFVASIVASDATANTDTPADVAEYDFTGKDITVKIADTEVGLATAEALELKTLGITFDQAIISDFILGSYNPADNYNSAMSIEGTFTKNHTDTVFSALNGTDTSKYMSIVIEGATAIASTYKPKIEIILNKVMITDWDKGDSNDALSEETVTFKAFYNITDEEQVKINLQNKTTAYEVVVSA